MRFARSQAILCPGTVRFLASCEPYLRSGSCSEWPGLPSSEDKIQEEATSHLLTLLRHQGCCWGAPLLQGLGPFPCLEKLLPVGGGARAGLDLRSPPGSSMLFLSSGLCVHKNVTCSLLKDLGEISSSKMQIFWSGISFAEISLRPVMRLSYEFPS